jgi:hypothetical protein
MNNTNQHDRNDPHKIMKLAKEERDQMNTRLAKYSQNSKWTSGWKLSSGHIRFGTRYVWFWRIYPKKLSDMSGTPRNLLLNFDSWAMRHQIRWNLDTRVTSTQETNSKKGFSPNPKISLPILDEIEESRFWRKWERSGKSKGLEPSIGGR